MKKILLVDDDQICNLLMSKTLAILGVTANQIQIALNGLEAINLLNEYTPDVILLDINMPIMDGFGFIEAFKRLDFADKKKVKIVIVSSSQSPKDVERARKMGVNGFLSKPVTIELLQTVIQDNTDRS